MSGRQATARAATVAALALLAGCAPRPVVLAPVTAGARADLYLSQLVQREERAANVEGEVTLWPRAAAPCDTCAPPRLPAAQAGFFLGWPEAFRLRVGSLFGTALDVALAGDSVTAYVPAGRWGVALDAARDSLGLERPGRLVVRLWCAAWRPPRGAWPEASPEGGMLVVRWCEAGDSIALAVDADGRPAWARQWRAVGRGMVVEYGRWETVDGVAWPCALEVRTLDGAFDLACRVERVTFPKSADGSRLAVRIPEGAERLGVAGLRGLLERAGVWR